MKKFHIIFAAGFILAISASLLSCRGPKIATADAQMQRGEYFDASKTYRKIYNSLKKEQRNQRGEVAYKLAEAHRMLCQYNRASAAYQNAIRYGSPEPDAQLKLAQMLQASGAYVPAIRAYEEFLMQYPDNEEAKRGLEGSMMARNLKENPTRHIVRQSRLFNSRRADFAPMLNGDVLYYTTTNEKVKGSLKSEVTGMKRSDIWMAKKNEQGQWQRPEPVDGDLNSDMDEGIVSFSPDGNMMYLTRAVKKPDSPMHVEIYTSTRSDAQWSAPQKFEITGDTISNFGHPSVSPDGRWLYFTSDMPGQGGKDIWRINLNDRIGTLENMGPEINTTGNEEFPYAYSDSLIYFSSDGHPGLGGLDIFSARLQPDGHWKIENAGMPMNSAADDFGITFDRSASIPSGFFSSNRGDARGYDHIYSFELPDLKVILSGYVTDLDEEPINGAVVRIVGTDGSNQRTATRGDGYYSLRLQPGVSYAMLSGAKGYLNARQEFSTDTAQADAEYGIDFMLASLSKPNIVENIFYDFDRATLRPESQESLNELAALLRDNPNITIEMTSHTDRHGSEEYNIDLSQRRAKSVIDYLIEAGISPDRLQYQGYGKSRPKTVTKRVARQFPQFKEGDVLTEEFILALPEDTDRDAADQINRRTEFNVLSVDYNMR